MGWRQCPPVNSACRSRTRPAPCSPRTRGSKRGAAAEAAGLPALADDSGLCIDALDGAPGIFSARWGGTAKDFDAAMARVNRELDLRGARLPSDRAAHFVSALCLSWPGGDDQIFEGRAFGEVVWPTARQARFWLRSDVPARRLRRDVRRDRSSRERQDLPPRPRVREVREGVFKLTKRIFWQRANGVRFSSVVSGIPRYDQIQDRQKHRLTSKSSQRKRAGWLDGILRSDVKASVIIDWLKSDFDLGRGHAMAIVAVLNGQDRDKA